MKLHRTFVLLGFLISTMSFARAGIVEDLLAVPAIQSLLGRVPELQAVVRKCADAKYKQPNAKVCQQAEDASRLAKVPVELRSVLSNPVTAASIRELCLAVRGNPAQNTFICAELYKADSSFKLLMDQQPAIPATAEGRS